MAERTRRLRVAVLSSLSRDSGGHLRALYLARYLERAGADVLFFGSTRSLPFFLDYVISAALHLRAAVRRFDVVIAQKPLFNVALPILLQNLHGGISVVDVDDDDSGFRTGLVSRVNAFLQRPLPRTCTIVTYHAPELEEILCGRFAVDPERLFRLPQAVDLEIFSPAARTACPAARPSAMPTVLYPAHLNVAADVDPVFRIFGIARSRMPELRLVVAGGGPLESRCRRLAEDYGLASSIHFTGLVRPEEVADLMRSAAAGIVYYEANRVNLYRESMKLREMLAVGLPVVCNGFGELARFREWTYQADGLEGLAAVLVDLVRTGGDGRETAGTAHVRETMDWAANAARLHGRLLDEITRVQRPATGFVIPGRSAY